MDREDMRIVVVDVDDLAASAEDPVEGEDGDGGGNRDGDGGIKFRRALQVVRPSPWR